MLTLQPRHRLDIRFRHFAYALSAALWARNPELLAARLAGTWSPSGHGIACRSVRSGFHLLLDAHDLEPGDEVLVSAITHPDMVRILDVHGLVAVPVDLDISTLAPRLELAERLVTRKTRAIMVAHLFGGRFDMSSVAAFAKQNRLLLWEDCAQAFTSPCDSGDPRADVSMYSFGALKTGTALGGALLKVKDRSLLERMRGLQRSWPIQRRRTYAGVVLKFFAFRILTLPLACSLLARAHRAAGRDFDQLVNSSVRAFRPGRLLPQLEVRPSAPLLASLMYRLRTFDGARLRRREAAGEWLAANLPAGLQLAGGGMSARTHWLFPVLTARPDELIAACRRAGFDAARAASSVAAVPPPSNRQEAEPEQARRMMRSLCDSNRESTGGGRLQPVHQGMTAQRDAAWDRLAHDTFDLLVVGAGIIGSRVAYEAARAGLKVALVDAGDFGGAASSGSSKLIHGGFRYLPMGDLGLVWESQRERRAIMRRIAPHLVRRVPMVLAAYRGGPKSPALAGAGVLAYGALCGFRGTGVGLIGARGAQRLVPALRTDGLTVCGLFDEGQTDDARLVFATVAAAAGLGVTVLNHARVTHLDFGRGGCAAACIQGRGDSENAEIGIKRVINAAGPWVDAVRRLEDPACDPMARLSKGVHLLLQPHAEWRAGLVVPLEEGRVTMAIPWQGMLMLGTTDTDYEGDPAAYAVTEADVAQVLAEASVALPRETIQPEMVRFSFAGLRVLPMGQGSTAGAHREHLIRTGPHGMLSIAGGKLTTHRRIALDVLHRVADPRLMALRLSDEPLRQAGAGSAAFNPSVDPSVAIHLAEVYGREASQVMAQRHPHPDALERIHPDGPDVWAQAYHAVEHEWAATVDDVVRRRTTLAVRGLASTSIRAQMTSLF